MELKGFQCDMLLVDGLCSNMASYAWPSFT